MALIAIGFLAVVFVMASRINRLLRTIDAKIKAAQGMADKVGSLLRMAQYFVKR